VYTLLFHTTQSRWQISSSYTKTHDWTSNDVIMAEPERCIPPPLYSLGWFRNETREHWTIATTKGRILLIGVCTFIVLLVVGFPGRWFLGILHYCLGYFRASALDFTLQESCALLRTVEGWPFGVLSYSDYLRWNRCLGNEAGFDQQGQLLIAIREFVFYILSLGGMIPYGGSPIPVSLLSSDHAHSDCI
jgi:hypothetical protein